MITPIMIDRIGWGTYLFFALVNACFIPVIYFLYPETKQRSLEEIDIIFAKGYAENISYVRAAKELPFLGDEEVEDMALKYGLITERGGGVAGLGMRTASEDEKTVVEGNVEDGVGGGGGREKEI